MCADCGRGIQEEAPAVSKPVVVLIDTLQGDPEAVDANCTVKHCFSYDEVLGRETKSVVG